MKVKTASILGVALTTAALALPAPVLAQRTVGTFRSSSPQRNVTPVPSTVILPMTNPIEPMGNPIAPIVSPPFIRYSGPTPTLVIPEQPQGNRGGNGRGSINTNNVSGSQGQRGGGQGPRGGGQAQRGGGQGPRGEAPRNNGQGQYNNGQGQRGGGPRNNGQGQYNNGQGQRGEGLRNNGRGGRVILVPVGVPVYYDSYYNYYPEFGLYPPPTIPGQLPGAQYYYPYQDPSNFNSSPAETAPAPDENAPVYEPQPEVPAEPRLTVAEPRPSRAAQAPPIGTTRAEVIARLGQPWGIIFSRGEETFYYDGLVVVIAADGRVRQIR